MRYLLHSSDAPENCGFVRWVDPPPLHLHQEYIYYLQNRIFDLEREVAAVTKMRKRMTIVMVQVNKRCRALIHNATALRASATVAACNGRIL
jgi:hypothetical protein